MFDAILLVIILVVIFTGLVPVLALVIVSTALLPLINNQNSISSFILIFLGFVTIPLCTTVLGILLSKLSVLPASRKPITILASCLGFYLMLEGNYLMYLPAIITQTETNYLILQLLNSAVFTVSICALAILFVMVLIELPVHFVFRQQPLIAKYISAFRPVLLILIISFLLEHISLALIKISL